MKRKLFLSVLCTVIGVGGAQAYTTDDLTSAGWTLVSSLSDNTDNVYVFVDAGSSQYAMSRNTSAKSDRPVYVALPNPFTTPSIVWTLETRNDGYAMRNMNSQYYFNSGSDGWNDLMAATYESGSFSFSLSDSKYSLRSVTVGGDNYVGPWNNKGSVSLGEDGIEGVAANKSAGHAPGFYIYKMAKATYALKYLQNCPNLSAPVDVSFLIVNPTIYQGGSATDLPTGWSNFGNHITGDNKYTKDTGNTMLQGWKKTSGTVTLDFDYYQRISNLPAGKYRVQAEGYGSPDRVKSYLYICYGTSKASKELSEKTLTTFVTDYMSVPENDNITLGIEAEGSHNAGTSSHTAEAFADNFRLEVNPYLSTIATSLSFPGSVSLAAGMWYSYDIPAANSYDFTSSDAATIYYTTATDPLLDATTTEEAFTTGQTKAIDLPSGRVYFKASAATTFSVAYRYVVGSAATDKSYIQPGQTVTVTYASLNTNDPSANVTQDFSGVTLGGNALSVTPSSNGFTFTVPALAAGTAYTLAIPAGTIGYAAGSTYNAAQNITLTTPAVFDGVYYLYNTYTHTYLSRSGTWATSAILDDKGLAINVATNDNNITTFQYFDNHLYLGGDRFCYGDFALESALNLTASIVEGGYKFLNNSNSKYLAVWGGASVGDAEEGNNLDGTSNIWVLESTSEHVANYTRNANTQAVTAASAFGLGGITTKAELDTELANNYNEISIDITGSEDEKYQTYAVWQETLAEAEYYKETVQNLPPGLYKLSVNAFQRAAWNDWVVAANGARGTIYLYANDAKTQLKSVFEYGAEVAYENNFESNGLNYPNNKEAGMTALNTGNYLNEVYVYVPADEGETTGTLTIGINNPTRQGNGVNTGTWACYNHWTLTRYDQTEVTMRTFANGTYGTFIAPFDVAIPSGVTASKVTGHTGNTLTLSEVSTTIPKNTPVVVYSDAAINETFKGKDGSDGVTDYTEGLLTGVYTATTVAAGNYVLQTNGGIQGFYEVGTGGLTTVPYRAYLKSDAFSTGVKAFFFDDIATGVHAVHGSESMVQGSEIYNLAGQRLDHSPFTTHHSQLKRGIYIVGGKKVAIK